MIRTMICDTSTGTGNVNFMNEIVIEKWNAKGIYDILYSILSDLFPSSFCLNQYSERKTVDPRNSGFRFWLLDILMFFSFSKSNHILKGSS